jgi:hypothetical protein
MKDALYSGTSAQAPFDQAQGALAAVFLLFVLPPLSCFRDYAGRNLRQGTTPSRLYAKVVKSGLCVVVKGVSA